MGLERPTAQGIQSPMKGLEVIAKIDIGDILDELVKGLEADDPIVLKAKALSQAIKEGKVFPLGRGKRLPPCQRALKRSKGASSGR